MGLDNQECRDMFPRATVKVIKVSTSDQMPLFLELNKLIYAPKKKRFCFENMWIKEEHCLNLVQESWTQATGRSILGKMDYCCLKLEEWGGSK